MSKVALILEGGGMRGNYTSGVLDFLLENNIMCDYCIGVSAGACQGVSYVSQQIGRNYKVNVGYIRDKRYLSLRNYIKTGSLFGMDMLFDIIPNELEPFDYKKFRESGIVFNIGTTNCETGLPEYYQVNDFKEEGYDAIRASISLPLVAPIVKYDGKALLDGGIADPIPIKKAIADGYDKCIVVLTQHKGYQKTKTSSLPVIKRKYKKYPKLVEAMARRHEVYNETLRFIDNLEKEGKCLVIRPSQPLNVGRFEKNTDKLIAIYHQGYEDARMKQKELEHFVAG